MKIDIQKNKEKIETLLGVTDMEKEERLNLLKWLEESGFYTAPASSRYHLNVEGGLAQHSLNVHKALRDIDNGFVPHNLGASSMIIVSLLHDVCKIGLYKDNILKSGKRSISIPYQKEEDFPIGHGEKSVFLLQKHITLTEQEAVCIRWHMGHYDYAFKSNENYIKAKYPEAFLVHFADHIATLFLDPEYEGSDEK